jgi:hypothetical protein
VLCGAQTFILTHTHTHNRHNPQDHSPHIHYRSTSKLIEKCGLCKIKKIIHFNYSAHAMGGHSPREGRPQQDSQSVSFEVMTNICNDSLLVPYSCGQSTVRATAAQANASKASTGIPPCVRTVTP